MPRGLGAWGRSVSWLTTASGCASSTARAIAAASRTSTSTGSAPARASAPARSDERVVPVTVCPAAISAGTSRRPIAPDAPARKTWMRGRYCAACTFP